LGNIRIVTDSTADIPAEVREKLGIEMVPLTLAFGDERFIDYVTIMPDQFYEKLVVSKDMPKTSQPSPMDFLEKYKQIAQESPGAHIISIHLASVLSGTYQSAVIAKSMMEEEDVQITVVDSRSASFGIGALVIAAAEAIQAGKSAEEVLAIIEKRRSDCSIYFMVDTLEYLQKNGRIGRAAGLIGSLLNIKPILTIDNEGYVAPIDKVRGQKKALARIVELMKEQVPGRSIQLYLAHVNNSEAAESLKQMIEADYEIKELDYVTIGPIIGCHTGPGLVAAFVFPA